MLEEHIVFGLCVLGRVIACAAFFVPSVTFLSFLSCSPTSEGLGQILALPNPLFIVYIHLFYLVLYIYKYFIFCLTNYSCTFLF